MAREEDEPSAMQLFGNILSGQNNLMEIDNEDQNDFDYYYSSPLADDDLLELQMEIDQSQSFRRETGRKKKSKKKVSSSMRRSLLLRKKFVETPSDIGTRTTETLGLTFEEQKEIEEPIEIDLRDIYKTYGINPVDNTGRQKLFRKQSNDIINFSIGEAYMKYAHGKVDEAINLLFEVIRMNPLNSEPYDALGDIYRKMGNYKKALEFYLIGIEFNQNDSKRWIELAEIANFNRMYKSALEFYSKAIKLSPRNLTYYIKKTNLLEQMKQYENAYKTYEKMMSYLEPDDYRIILSISFRIANLLFHQMNCPEEALQLIENIIQQHKIEENYDKFESFRLYLANYFDLLLANGHLSKVFTKFLLYNLIKMKESNVNFDYSSNVIEMVVNNLKADDSCFNCANLVIKSKLVCACLYLNHFDLVKRFLVEFESIEDENTQESVYRPIIPALMQLSEYQQAYVYVSKLLKSFHSSKYWFWCGFCLRKLCKIEEAIIAYEKSIQIDQNNYDAVNELSELCNQIGIPERALDNVNLDHLKVNIHLLMNRCNLLFVCKRWSEFINNCRLLLSSRLYFLENLNDIKELLMRSLTVLSLMKSIKSLRRKCSKTALKTELSCGYLTCEQYFQFWKKSIFVLLNYTSDYEQAVRWAFSGLMSPFSEELIEPLLLIIFRTCIDAKARSLAFDLGKILAKEYRSNGKVWFAFSAMMSQLYHDLRHKRFLIRLWAESPDNVNILLMNGHIAFSSSRYIHALGIYLMVYRMRTSYRYDSFHVALAYLHLLCQMHTLDKCSLFSQMISFLHDYMKKIGKCQETYYNVGRAFHQIGFIRYAIELYQVALQTPLKVHDHRYELSPEIAFNLAQIYRQSKQHQKANELIVKYCSI